MDGMLGAYRGDGDVLFRWFKILQVKFVNFYGHKKERMHKQIQRANVLLSHSEYASYKAVALNVIIDYSKKIQMI